MLLRDGGGGVVPSAKGAHLKFLKEERTEEVLHPEIMEAGMRMENDQGIINAKNKISHSKGTYTKILRKSTKWLSAVIAK